MEVLVCCCIGALTGFCVAGVLESAESFKAAGAFAIRNRALQALGALGGVLVRTGAVPARFADVLIDELRMVRAGRAPFTSLNRQQALGALAVLSLGCGAVAAAASGMAVLALPGLAAPGALLLMRSRKRARETQRALEQALPEAFGALAISLGSGHSLAQAMRFVGARSEEPLRTEFTRVSFAISCGIPACEALDAMLERMPAPGLGFVSLALKVSQRTGAPLKDLLAEASQLVGERIELARLLDVKTSQARMSAQLVAGMPLVMTVFLMLFSSDFQRGVATFAGACSVGLALALDAVAWIIIRRIMKVDM